MSMKVRDGVAALISMDLYACCVDGVMENGERRGSKIIVKFGGILYGNW